MPFRPQSRFRALAPSVFFLFSLGLVGCATQPAGPVGPISTGQPRVDPVPETVDEVPVDPDIVINGQSLDPEDVADPSPIFTPPHMAGRQIVRAGVMLPFTDRRAGVRAQAEGMLAAIELALFDGFGQDFVLMPKDTQGSQETAAALTEELVDEGADLILGPLFAANVTAVRTVDERGDIPVVSFSNDRTVAGNNTWLASIAPEAEVREIVNYAVEQGYDSFAFFGPQSSLGVRIEQALKAEAFRYGILTLPSGFYPSGSASPSQEAELFATRIAAEVEIGRKIAVLVPERGNRLRQIAPLLAYHGVDTRVVKLLGLSSWDDPDIWREPSLRGAWFTAAPPDQIERFNARYERQYGRAPSSLAAVAYDAAALAMALSVDGDLRADELETPDGFAGVNGLFRFTTDGTAERSLSIMEVYPNADAGGVRMIRPAAQTFRPDGS